MTRVIDLSRALRERTRLLIQSGECAACHETDWLDEDGFCVYCGKCPACGQYACPVDACQGQPSMTLFSLGEKWRETRARVERQREHVTQGLDKREGRS